MKTGNGGCYYAEKRNFNCYVLGFSRSLTSYVVDFFCRYDRSCRSIVLFRRRFLYGTYPFVGSDEDSNYYLDPSSAYFANRESSVPALGGLVYKVKKGSGDVAVSQLDPYNVTFSTYTGNSERYISVDRVMHNGVNVRQEMTENNQAFFDSLFWKIADVTGATEYWRTHVNN